jgi:hypothetical protein
MSDPKPMPRQAVIAAGGLILLAAVAGLGMGIARNFHDKGGIDTDTGEVVAPIKGVASATALVAPPVTEADVRRWTREELQAQHAAQPKKPKADADPDLDPDASPATPTPGATPGAPATLPPAAKPAPAQQIPF